MAISDSLLGTANVAFFYGILIWLLVDSLRLSQRNHVAFNLKKRRPTVFATVTVLSSAVISVLNVAFAFYTYSTRRIIGYNSVSLAVTWVLATTVSLYSVKNNTLGENNRFPLVLILWWVFACIVDMFSVSLKLVKINLESLNLWFFLSEENNIVDAVSLPLLLFLCFNALPNVCAREQSEMEQRLLQKEMESSVEEDEDEEAFTKASRWSKLTFRWLNPIFSRGRIQKLEHAHIPSVPRSEAAESASSMLEESLRKQKLEGGSLVKAITHSIWKSLALNAVLAGTMMITNLFILCTFMQHSVCVWFYSREKLILNKFG